MENLKIKFLDKDNGNYSIELKKQEECIVFKIEAEDFGIVDIELNLETAKLLLTCLNEML